MPYTPTGYEAAVATATLEMACAVAAWQAATATPDEAASVATAKGQTVLDWGGPEDLNCLGGRCDLSRSWLIVRSQGMREDALAWYTVARSGIVLLVLHTRAAPDDTPLEGISRARDLAGAIADGMRAQLGQPGKLRHALFDIGETTRLAQSSAGNTDTDAPSAADELETLITCTWSEVPR
jgi:hypothetical protein